MDPTDHWVDPDRTLGKPEPELDEIDREVERALGLIHRIRKELERQEVAKRSGEPVRRIGPVEVG